MKIFLIGMYENVTTDRLMAMTSIKYAHFSALGTWADEREPCRVCDWHWQTIVPPLLVRWEPSSEVIGDFSWDGPFGYTFVVQESVAKALETLQFGCRFMPVEYLKPKRSRNTVPYPYQGPKLLWCDCITKVDLDMAASEVTVESTCSACGNVRYKFRYNGIVIRRSAWNGQHMFQITTNGRSDATFVSEEGCRLIETAGFTNIAFTKAGEIVE